MEEKQMIGQMDYDFDIWYKTKDPVFSEINKKSRIPDKWLLFDKVLNGKYKNSILKPINRYVEVLVPKPKLINITGNVVTLQQGNHAEIFLLQNEKFFKNIDRPWMRQYYNTIDIFDNSNRCFMGFFKFYVPWYIDADVKILYSQAENSPFEIYETSIDHKEINENIEYLEPDFVLFSFKKEGEHMLDDTYGKIKRQSPMFNIVFECDDIMLKRVKEIYEQE